MKRPLFVQERVDVDVTDILGLDTGLQPGISQLVASTLFLLGQVLGGYPHGRVGVMLSHDAATASLSMQVTITVPLEELGA